MSNRRTKTKKNSGTAKRSTAASTKRTQKKSVSGRKSNTSVEENEIPEALYTEIGILFLLAFCIILILGNFGLTLRFGDIFNSLFFGLFGGMEYLFPFCFFIGVCFYLINRENRKAVIRLISAVVLFFDIGMFLQLFVTDDYNLGGYSGTYDYSMSNRSGGGVIAGGFFELLRKNLGKPAAIIIVIIIFIICFLVLTGNSLIKMLSYPGMELADRAKESRIEREKDMEAIREERELIKEERRIERSKKRAAEREEKRKRYRENSKSKGRNKDIFSLTVGDGDKAARDDGDDSFLQNDVFDNADKMTAEPATAETSSSQGYSPFAMSPEHMVKPKDYDKKPEPKPIPEVRLKESEVEREAEEREIEYSAFSAFNVKEESFGDAFNETTDDADDVRTKEDEDRFYEELMLSHEAEESDMHEITFDDEDAPLNYSFNEELKLHSAFDKEEGHETGDFNFDMKELVPEPEEPETEEVQEAEEEPEEPDAGEESFDMSELVPEPEEPDAVAESFDMSELVPEAGEEPEPEESETGEENIEADEESFDAKELSAEPEKLMEESNDTEQPEEKPYELPPVSLLKAGKEGTKESEGDLRATAEKLQDILSSFGVRVRMLNYIQGPTVTRFEMQPEQGVKVNTILNLSNDIQMNLAAKDIRIEAPIPGKAAVGIEIPNKSNSPVMLRDLIESRAFQEAKSKITIAIGKDISGDTIVYDIDKMPHLLIAGATGSGKSVCINTIIMSILYKAKPDEVKLIMIDPKVVELSIYNGIPHLLTPVVTDPVKAAGALNWGVSEMMKRYQLFARAHVRNMEGYNEKVPELNRAGETLIDGSPYETLPQIVIIVDELADLMMVQKKDVEASICRLAQLARAAGIHLIIATQRPSVDVITGLIKANMPSRVAFAVSSNVDSRTILDSAGAEKLLGNGDMLFYPQKYPKPERLQGAFVSDEEVQSVTDFIRDESVPADDGKGDIAAEIEAASVREDAGGASDGGNEINPLDNDDGRDSYFADAGRFVIEKNRATIGVLQRMFRIGFNRAARIMDQLSDAGVVSGEDGTKPRQVLMTMEEFEAFLEGGSPETEEGNNEN